MQANKLMHQPCDCCRELRGFGFVQYLDPEDAAEAKYQMDGQILLGRELTVVFAEESRKKPAEMRARERRRSLSYDYRSPHIYSHYSDSRSPSLQYFSHSRRYSRSWSCSSSYYSSSPRWQDYSRSVSPQHGRYYRGQSFSRLPSYSRSRSRS